MSNILKRTKRDLIVSLLALLVTLFLLGSQVAEAASWKVVSSPNPGTSSSLLYGVAAVSSHNVWAVGTYVNTNGPEQALIEHWNGTAWTVVSHPNPGTRSNWLNGVVAVSSTNLWAVGAYANANGPILTLIEHWNGTSWKVVASPSVGPSFSSLYGVAAVSANDVWAVGTYASTTRPDQALIEHWNGTAWTVVSHPAPGTRFNYLYDVVAVSARDVWAMGTYANANVPSRTLIEHWNGTNWKVVASPNPSAGNNALRGVAALSATNIWAVGAYQDSRAVNRTLIEHWNGTAWTVVSSPNASADDNSLDGVAAVNATNIWAVGIDMTTAPYRTLIEHWNGTNWNVVSSPNPGTSSNNLYDVAAACSTIWAVGSYMNINGPPPRTLIEEYS